MRKLVEEESTLTAMAALREVIQTRGCSVRCTAIAAATFSSRPKLASLPRRLLPQGPPSGWSEAWSPLNAGLFFNSVINASARAILATQSVVIPPQ
jgi:hypothetical protein